MPAHSSPAVVLSARDFGESDRIVELFTEKLGRISCVAKGAKRSTKRFANTLESFSLIEANIFEKSLETMARLTDASLREPFLEIRADAVRTGWASFVLELVKRFTAPRDPDPRLFRLVVHGLDRFRDDPDPSGAAVLLTFRVLSLVGLGPELARCVACQKDSLLGQELLFSPSSGGVVCRDHGKPGLEITPGTARLLAGAETSDPEKLWRLKFTRKARAEALGLMVALVRHHLGEEPRTFRVLRQFGAL